jgi:hypothetical protein
MPADLSAVLAAADLYREQGWNPLPSRADAKRPVLRYAALWDRPLPAADFERLARREWESRGGCNVQCMTGARWGLAVVDLDGAEPVETWRAWSRFRPEPPTWRSASFEADGRVRGVHVWYSLPVHHPPIPSRLLWGLWDGQRWLGRSLAELLGDRKLVMAPPSVHPRTGQAYAWLPGSGPDEITLPALLPDWVRNLPSVSPPRPEWHPLPRMPLKSPVRPVAGFREHRRVFDAIPDRIALVASWGLRFASDRPGSGGWYSCHALGREDRHPSAGFHPGLGVYCEPGAGVYLRFFELAVAMGVYADWRDAVEGLGSEYKVPVTLVSTPSVTSNLSVLHPSPIPTLSPSHEINGLL